jgi:hypothetical protein
MGGMMTFDYKIIPVQNEVLDSAHKIDGFPERRKAFLRKFKRDKRTHRIDRRSSVRDGVIVRLSFKGDRRKGSDRRRLQTRF